MANIESRLVRITADHCSKLILWNMPSRVMPALLTRMSTGPSSASTAFTPSAEAAASATSHLKVEAPVSALNFAAASSLP